MRYGPAAVNLILAAGRHARSLGHSYVGSVHFLLALVEENGISGRILRGIGIYPALIRDMAVVLHGIGTPELPLPQGLTREARHILRGDAGEAQLRQSKDVESAHVLLALR